MRTNRTFHSRKCHPILGSLVLLVTLLAGSIAENEAQAATQCKSTYSHTPGNVVDHFYYDGSCGGYWGIPNAMNVRSVRSNGDRVCYTLVPPPPGYVVTAVFYDSVCGRNSRAADNTGILYPVRSGMNVCLWGPKLPAGYKVNRTYYDSACGYNRNAFANTANIVSTTTGSTASQGGTTAPSGGSSTPSTPSRPPSVSIAPPLQQSGVQLVNSNDWYQIQTASSYREVYQGNGGKFVSLPAGTYNIINLSSGLRKTNVVVR